MVGRGFFAAALASTVSAGTVLWDGRFNDLTSSTDLNKWSFSNEVGPYQYYIHGSGPVTEYVNLDSSYKNPADTSSKQGVKITIDSTSHWNSDMFRTELIPQTTAAINKGLVYYHFSMKRSATNAPDVYKEHQVNFFESHFTEMKAGWINGESGTADYNLQWMTSGQSQWKVVWDADVWHNVAYGIDFTANTVTFYHSTGADALVKTAGPISVSASSNGADWHLGVLRLPRSGYADSGSEDWYYSGVYIESGSLTTSVVGPGGGSYGGGSSSSAVPTTTSTATATTFSTVLTTKPVTSTPVTTTKPVTTTTTTTTSKTVTTTAPSANCAGKYAQCGGIGYSGATCCASGSTCVVSNPYYSQCL